jgi:hypothetical protein
MLGRCVKRPYMRPVRQKNTNTDLIPDEQAGKADEEGIPIVHNWTDRVFEDRLVLGDDVEQSVQADLEFAPWYETVTIDHHEDHSEG